MENQSLITQLAGQAWEELTKVKDFRKLGLQTGCVMTREGIDPPYPVSIDGVEFYEFQNEPLGEPVPTLPTSVQRVSSEVTRDDEGEEEDPDGEEDQTEQGSKAVGLLQQDEDLNEVDSVILDYEEEGVLETDTNEVDLPLPPPPPGFGFAPIPTFPNY